MNTSASRRPSRDQTPYSGVQSRSAEHADREEGAGARRLPALAAQSPDVPCQQIDRVLPVDDRFSGGGNRTPNSVIHTNRRSLNMQGTATQVLNNSTVNEIRVGYGGFGFWQHPGVNWSNHPNAPGREMGGSPILNMTGGFLIGQGHANSPVDVYQKPYSFRDDLTLSHQRAWPPRPEDGRRDIHMGQTVTVCDFCMPTYDMQGGPVPANIATIIPNLFDPNTWNLAALSPITRSMRLSVGTFTVVPIRHEYAAWAQDDWTIGRKLTVNLGLRHDLEVRQHAEDSLRAVHHEGHADRQQ